MGASNMQFQMIANKLANEILQCSIDFFNKHRDENSEFDLFNDALKIAKYAKRIGSTGQARNRIDEAIATLEDMRFSEAFQLISLLKEIIGVFEEVKKENSSMQAMIDGRRTSVNEEEVMKMIKPIFTEQLVRKIANSNKDNLINDFNGTLDKIIVLFSDVYSDFFKKKRNVFISNLPIANSIKYNFVKSKLYNEISNLKSKLSDTKNKQYYSSELFYLNNKIADIKEWKLFRSSETKKSETSEQQQKINKLIKKGETAKKRDISRLEKQIVIIRGELKRIN